MKKNELSKLLFNPFVRIAGLQAFLLGVVAVIITGVIAKYSNISFDGVLDLHFIDDLSWSDIFIMLLIDILCITLVMWITALVFSKQTRLIDILGTMTLSRAPYLLLAIFALFVEAPSATQILADPSIVFHSTLFLIFIAFSLPVTIWFIVLMYNGLKVSSGAKGISLAVGFILALLISETLSKILIYYLI